MNIFLKLLPIILISIIFYLLIYTLYPQYQKTLSLTKKLNELQNKEKELIALEKLITALSQNANIQQLIANQETLNLWLPQQPKIEEILASLNGIYQTNNLIFRGANINIAEEPKQMNPDVLPVRVINISFSAPLNSGNLISFIEGIEKNVRLMQIKQASLSPESSEFKVESYYLSDK
ncbi:MAG: hypothetical protein KatS3mg096_015 [Candidatus Parcubacteria bacterium]|nr:MAG: hypothetical protein KatS3mg096_015 [Candidatus Parcubacteria bacterium]